MRLVIPGLIFLALFGCATKSPDMHDAGVIVKYGLISAREEASLDQIESDIRTRTSVHISASSGGRVSIGLGFLLSQFSSGATPPDPVRYQVDIQDGGQIMIYHDSRDFAVGDCVQIVVYPDEEKHPPTMKRNHDGC